MNKYGIVVEKCKLGTPQYVYTRKNYTVMKFSMLGLQWPSSPRLQLGWRLSPTRVFIPLFRIINSFIINYFCFIRDCKLQFVQHV